MKLALYLSSYRAYGDMVGLYSCIRSHLMSRELNLAGVHKRMLKYHMHYQEVTNDCSAGLDIL